MKYSSNFFDIEVAMENGAIMRNARSEEGGVLLYGATLAPIQLLLDAVQLSDKNITCFALPHGDHHTALFPLPDVASISKDRVAAGFGGGMNDRFFARLPVFPEIISFSSCGVASEPSQVRGELPARPLGIPFLSEMDTRLGPAVACGGLSCKTK